jgi:formylglycine-generating enzyme required for sulfatase activity
MNTNLLNIVKQIIADYGEAILKDPQRLKALFGDLAKDEPKPLRLAFGRCIESGAYTALKTAPDTAERALRKKEIAQRVNDEQGLDIRFCTDALDILETALYGAIRPKPPVCKTCGEKLQEGWKACPHCGAAAGNTAPSLSPQTPTTASTEPPEKNNTARNVLITVAIIIMGVIIWAVYTNNSDQSVSSTPVPVPTPAPAPNNMVRIPGGTFQMGNNNGGSDEKPAHTVTVSAFYMGKYEVTQREWQEVMGSNPSSFKGDNLPVEDVSWLEVIEYCNKRSIREGRTPAYTVNGTSVSWNRNANGYRLPTEAEWEYAARGSQAVTVSYSGSNNIDVVAWYGGNSGNKTHPVGTKQPNSFGLYDMSGNVWEWCWDWHGAYASGSQNDPQGPATGSDRVIRGGSWNDDASFCALSFRFSIGGGRIYYLGFRVACP